MAVGHRVGDFALTHHLQQIAILQRLIRLLDDDRRQGEGGQHLVQGLQALVVAGAMTNPDALTGEFAQVMQRFPPLGTHHPLLDPLQIRAGEVGLLAAALGGIEAGQSQIALAFAQHGQHLVITHRQESQMHLQLLTGEVTLVQPAFKLAHHGHSQTAGDTLIQIEVGIVVDHQHP